MYTSLGRAVGNMRRGGRQTEGSCRGEKLASSGEVRVDGVPDRRLKRGLSSRQARSDGAARTGRTARAVRALLTERAQVERAGRAGVVS